MQSRCWNKVATGTALSAFTALALAQAADKPATAPTLAPAPIAAQATAGEAGDILADAIACRLGEDRYPNLIEQLRQERPRDFQQVYRQYSEPMLDLYQLESPVQAWGHDSDVLLIASNRVMMAVQGSLEDVTARLERALEQSKQSPLSGALDDKHALVIYNAALPGLEGMVLLGCEYRIPNVSLLDNPDDAWRGDRASPAPVPRP